jgi:IMP cyclohydrolase
MKMDTLDEKVITEFNAHLRDNPCRGLIVGAGPLGDFRQIAWIMGRSENSQNRKYTIADGIMRTEAIDLSKVKDPSLIIYNVMRSWSPDGNALAHIVSNGNQTDTIIDEMETGIEAFGGSFGGLPQINSGMLAGAYRDALNNRFCEPDASIFTPRITGMQLTDEPKKAYLAILKADTFAVNDWKAAEKPLKDAGYTDAELGAKVEDKTGLKRSEFPTIRDFFERPVNPGYGWCLTTYNPGSKELPSFSGEPKLVRLEGGIDDNLVYVALRLEQQWLVAIGGRSITDDTVWYATPLNFKVPATK